jgi:hypothetical protein
MMIPPYVTYAADKRRRIPARPLLVASSRTTQEIIMQPSNTPDPDDPYTELDKIFTEHPKLARAAGWADLRQRIQEWRTWTGGLDQAVADFHSRHAGNKWLTGADPIYALNRQLLDLLVGAVPDFFTDEELEFEQDLTNLTREGFLFRGRVSRYHLTDGLIDEMAAGTALSFALAQRIFLTELGHSSVQIDHYLQRLADIQAETERRAAAYAGWLVSSATFQAEREELRERWGQRLAELGVGCGLDANPGDGEEDEAIHHYREFLERWVLAGLLAWELPCPLTPELLGVTGIDPRTRFFGGVHVFLPWYLLKDKHFQLQEIAKLHQPNMDHRHLRPWFATAAKTKQVGQKRFGYGLQLYRFWTLALERRYLDRFQGNVERLHGVFGDYLGVSRDSIKKLRREFRLAPAGTTRSRRRHRRGTSPT